MARGGKRPGSGRKKGAATKKTRAIADRAAAEGVTPLEVMLAAMRAHYQAERLDEAAKIAREAAPYIHPRLSAVSHKGDGPGGSIPISFVEVMTTDEAPRGDDQPA